MNSYCSFCQEVTDDYSESDYWNKLYNMVKISCQKCGCFKHQYLEEGGEQSSGK